MKVFRFMSQAEFDKYCKGETLENNINHKENWAYSNSKGFCFLDYDYDHPDYAYDFLSGIVSNDICAVFEVDEKLLNLSENNQYADPYGDFFDTILIDEYCTETYSNKDFKLVEYYKSSGIVFDFKNFTLCENPPIQNIE